MSKTQFSPSLIKEANQVLAKARARAFKLLPYMMDAVYALIPHPCELPPLANGMAVSKDGVLFYDPEKIVNEWKIDDVVTGLFHEAEHVLRKHFKRRIERDPDIADQELWLIATDCEINDDLEAMQLPLFPTDAKPSKYRMPNGKTLEFYFDELKSQAKSSNRPHKYGRMCGSGGGFALPNEEEIPDLPKIDEKVREVQLEAMRESVASAVLAHGTAPASLKRWATEQKKEKKKQIDWKKQLAVSASRAVSWARGHTHSTFSNYSRRQAGLGFGIGSPIMSGTHRPIANIALVQDTSGSMSDASFRQTIEQAGDILQASGGRVTFMSIDAIVHATKRISNANQINRLLIGGGGTDFRPAFEALEKMKPRPNVIVFATDGYGCYPEAEPKWCKTIWLMCTAYRPPWGTPIYLPHVPLY